jgi:uncharacterized protein (DUF2236 family)
MRGAGDFTPDSAIWKVNRHAVLLLGGGRALLMQAAHPLALAGVLEHSNYAERGPWDRLERTLKATSVAVFGRPEAVERVGRRVRAMHARVHGRLERDMGPFAAGTPYDARDPELQLWVHATLVDTALLMYRTFVGALSEAEEESYYRDMKRVAEVFGLALADQPDTLADFRDYKRGMLASEVICVTAEARALAPVVLSPPLPAVARPAWQAVNLATAGFLPRRLREGYGLWWTPAHRALLASSAAAMRRGVMPVLPDPLRADPGVRRLERRLGAERAPA